MNELKVSPKLGRPIRQDAPADLGRPTREFVFTAIEARDGELAREYLEYLFQEHFIIRDLNAIFSWHLVRYVLDRAPEHTWQSLLEETIAPWIATTAGCAGQPTANVAIGHHAARLTAASCEWDFYISQGNERYLITLGPAEKQQARWDARREQLFQAAARCDRALLDEVLAPQLREELLVHDIYGDWAWSLLSLAARLWGEECLGDMLRVTQDPWLTPRYAKAAQMNAEESLQLAVEGMRGHFAGPGRVGEVTVTDEPSRYVISFDACGSGGRMRRGDPVWSSPSRLAPPYNFLNIAEAHPFTWNRKGVCAYCAHCAVALQMVPIERLGFPIRVTEYPDDPRDPCRWIIYKSPGLIPDEAYLEVGHAPPVRNAR